MCSQMAPDGLRLGREERHTISRVIRQHQPIPQVGEYLEDGTPAILCKCNDIDEYNPNGYTDHLTLQILDAVERTDV